MTVQDVWNQERLREQGKGAYRNRVSSNGGSKCILKRNRLMRADFMS